VAVVPQVLAHLASSIHAVALSFRGHGESSMLHTGYAITDLAADIAALHEAIGLAAAVIVGHSLGSAVALRFAIDMPHRRAWVHRAGATGTQGH
jgi:non-heme chloroperoxidase